jgi:electron transfer flavoprotein alpha/beta subunit
MTTVLQRLVHHLDGADLMLLGAEVVDADLAQLGPRLAMALGWPFVEGAQEIFVQGHGVRAITRPRASVRRPAPAPPFADQERARGPEESAGARQTDGFHQIEADLPAVISVARDSNKPRYSPGARLVNVYQANDIVEILTAADLGLSEADLAPLTERHGESFPPERELGKVAEGSLDEIAGRVMDVIRKR